MTDQINKRITKGNRQGSKPRVTKLYRQRSHKIQVNMSINTPSHNTIRTSIGLSNRTDATNNQTNLFHSIDALKNRRWTIAGNKPTVSVISRFQANRSKVGSYSEKKDLEQQSSQSVKELEDNDELKKDKIISASKMNRYQNITHDTFLNDNRSDLRHSTNRSSSQMKFLTGSIEEFHRKNRKKRKVSANCWRFSRLCIFFSILAAILIATAITAALISVLIETNTTTKLTTVTTVTMTSATTTTITTETTTITYAPTGIWDLQIPTCATWNSTGVTIAGNANGTAGNDSRSFDSNASIFIDNNYTLYVCDRDNHRIMKYEVNATTGTVVAGTGLAGSSSTELYHPKGVAVDQLGAIIVADSVNYRIQSFPLGSLVGTTVASNSTSYILGQTRDLHIDVNNGIYVTDSDYSRIAKFYPSNGVGVTLAGTSGIGTAADQFNTPFGNFIDGNQTLFVADRDNHRVQKWPTGGTTGSTVAGITSSVGSNLTQLNNPVAVITDNNGYLYIVDLGNDRIVRWTTNYTAGGTCIIGCGGSAGVGATQLKNPRDIKFDASGNIYVCDQGNNRVQKYAIQTSNCSASG